MLRSDLSNKSKVPKVSVICIALSQDEFIPIQEKLSRQTFQDFEFVGESGGTIPEAWNRAIQKSKGEILVITETDASPVNNYWLEDLINSIPDQNSIIKGLEITESPWDLSNIAAYRSIFDNVKFDEEFRWAEDTEMFSRLKQKGVKMVQVNTAPVIHSRGSRSKHYYRRAFRYGLYWARLRYRYKDPVEIFGVMDGLKILTKTILNLLGMGLGYLLYWPEIFRK